MLQNYNDGLIMDGKMDSKKILIISGVLLLSAVSAFWRLTSATLDSHECFVSVTAREMLQSGDYIWPTLNGVPRLQKTPLSYWLVAGVGKITGNVNEFSARLPSAVFAVLSAIALFYYLNKWLSFRIAAISTAVWATSFAYIRCSHRARPDMVMAFFIILCMLSFYSIVTSKNRREQVFHMLIFWIGFALANLAKGPAPTAYVAVPLAVYIVIKRDWKIIGRLQPVIGVFIVLAVILPWVLFIARKLNWDLTLWKHEFVDRFFGDYAPGNYPIYFYLGMMFKYITPWVVFLPVALIAPFTHDWKEKKPLMMYMWIWFVAGMIFLTIDAGKRQHYILPLMPAMAVLIGILLDDMIFTRTVPLGFIKNIVRIHIVILIGGALISPFIIVFVSPHILGRVIILSVVTIVCTIAVLLLLSKNKPAFACIGIFSGITVFVMISYISFGALIDIDRPARDFAEKIAQIVPSSDKLIAYEHTSSRFVQYFGKVVPEVTDISELSKDYDKGYWIVCASEHAEELKNVNFRTVYLEERDKKDKSDAGGVLFNKSAPVVTGDLGK
jgi:4-amino-4-deoxy-L-arabinose transferase-like glycosyltransferase